MKERNMAGGRMIMRQTLLVASLIGGMIGGLVLPSGFSPNDMPPGWGAAWADDHDDDDDDDDDGADDDGDGDDGADDDGGRQGRSSDDAGRALRRAPQPLAQRGILATPLPAFAPREIIVSDLLDADLALLAGEGFAVIERTALSELGSTLTRLTVPAGQPLEQARDRVRALASGQDADFNHYYRTGQAEPVAAALPETACLHQNCPAFAQVGWPADREAVPTCHAVIPVGMIDTGINADHEILAGAQITLIRQADPDQTRSQSLHGTAVASLLVGNRASRVPGLIPEADLVAIDVFSRDGSDERADTAALVRGLDQLAARDVRVINLSLAGPTNSLMRRMLDRLTAPDGLDAVLIAAAGNGGPAAEPVYPAAHPSVLAVTAVDARGRVYGRAQRGPHLDLAAPGVNLLAATSIRGARGKSGTSFAVPFVTAAAALHLSRNPQASGAEIAATLRRTARDLGAAGPDAVFGDGLLSAAGLCSTALAR